MRRSKRTKTKSKGLSRFFFLLLCTLAAVVLLAPPTPMEKRMHGHVIYISQKHASREGAPGGAATPGPGASAQSGEAKAGQDAEPDAPQEGGSEEDEDEGIEEEVRVSGGGGYKRCPRATSIMKPTLGGLNLDFTQGKHGFNVTNTFIHKGNYEQLLHGDYTLHRHTVPELPDSFEEISRNYKFNSCAVVGSSGYMKLAQFGQAIDTHDIVVRLNQSPVKAFARWVGTKTTMRVLNSLWSSQYGSGRYENMALPLEQNVTILVSRTKGHTFDKMVDTMKKRRPDVRVLQLSSRVVSAARRLLVGYRVKLCQNGFGPYSGGSTPSSGFVAVYFLRSLCKRVTVYGLGTVNIPDVPYHYFAGVGSRKKGNTVHSWDSESATIDAFAWEDKVEQCKYRTRDLVPHGDQKVSGLRTKLQILQQHKYNNRFCGWNLCNRRGHHKLGQMLPDAKNIKFETCRRIMYNE